MIQLDGFKQEDYDRVSKVFKTWYGINLDNREHALRGWNWGKADFGKAELSFNVANRPAFEVPYTEISNTNLAGKNEVAVDFSLPADGRYGQQMEHWVEREFRGKKSAGLRGPAGRDALLHSRCGVKEGEEPRTVKEARGVEDGEETERGQSVLRDAYGQGRDW